MNKKQIINKIIFCAFLLLLTIPFFINIFYFDRNEIWSIFESSVFSLDYRKFLFDFIKNKSVFYTGLNRVDLITYVPIYLLLFVLEIFFRKTTAYIIFVIIFISLGFYSLVGLLNKISINYNIKNKDNIFLYFLSCLITTIFLSSLSNFLLLQHNFLFLLSTIVLLIQIYQLFIYLQYKKKIALFILQFVNLLNIFNITLFVINFTTINCFYFVFKKILSQKIKIKETIKINILFIPFLIFILSIFLISGLYSGNVGDYINIIEEDFYSNNTNYINIFNQTTYWGLFDGFNGELYYNFSGFYKNKFIYILGFLPYIILNILIFIYYKKYKSLPREVIIILCFVLFIFQFIRGLKNPVYRFLYNHFHCFQVFRNITKFAPILILFVFILIFILFVKNNLNLKQKFLLCTLILLSAFYNIPYWRYCSSFIKNRSVTIPEEYIQISDYINKNLDYNDKIFVLPATYVNDSYLWNNKNNNISGYLFDSLIDNNIKTFRLSQISVGSILFQKDINDLFIAKNNIRNLDVDYKKLIQLIEKYNFNYLLLTSDFKSEYQNYDEIINWIEKNNFSLIKSFGDLYLYRINDTKYININNKHHINIINPYFIKIKIYDIDNSISIYQNDFFNRNWGLYILNKKLPDKYHLSKNNLTKWILDIDYLRENFSEEELKELDIVLYFKPQFYFILSLLFLFIFLTINTIIIFHEKDN